MSFMDKMQTLLNNSSVEMKAGKFLTSVVLAATAFSLGVAIIMFLLNYHNNTVVITGGVLFIIFLGVFYGFLLIRSNARIAEIEMSLPDFLSLMGSNLRSGLTPDRAFILSVRKEFGPLEDEIDLAAKEIISGKSFNDAFIGMAKRINSEMFAKSVRLIIEGVNSGGDLADLLENTALDIRRFSAVRKEITATVRVYELFIVAAATVGAPLLYGVASFLVEIVSEVKSGMDLSGVAAASLPILGGTESVVPPEVVYMFSLAAISITAFFGALTAGVISKGKETETLVYIPIMLTVAMIIFFGIRYALGEIMGGFFL